MLKIQKDQVVPLNVSKKVLAKEIFNDIEHEIVNKKLLNDKEKIKDYILENYL